MKSELKGKAIELRHQGLSYSEILNKVPVAKSTLSLWLRSVGLSKEQNQRLTEKKLNAALRGAARKYEMRVQRTTAILKLAAKDIGKISKRELFLIGIALYWAEGSKEKENRPGSGVQFTNSDSEMVYVFLKWLFNICKIEKDSVSFDLYIHENNKNRTQEIINHWSNITNFPKYCFQHIYFKKNKTRTNRKNIGKNYFGVIKVKVRASSILNRKIAGWINGVVKYL